MTSLIETDGRRLLRALSHVLERRSILSPHDVEERIALTDRASPALGAAMVARAWLDPDYRAVMVADGTRAAELAGVTMRGLPPLGVLENTEAVHHLVVCTLCSCYPRAVLGYPPYWFKSTAFRARAVRDPRGLLSEWGTKLDETTGIRVIDSTADYRWMVLPRRPDHTEGWSAEQLAAVVRAGDMVGVTIPEVPSQG